MGEKLLYLSSVICDDAKDLNLHNVYPIIIIGDNYNELNVSDYEILQNNKGYHIPFTSTVHILGKIDSKNSFTAVVNREGTINKIKAIEYNENGFNLVLENNNLVPIDSIIDDNLRALGIEKNDLKVF